MIAKMQVTKSMVLANIDRIVLEISSLAESGGAPPDMDTLLGLQERIDEAMSTLFGGDFQFDVHAVRIWPIDAIDSRLPSTSQPAYTKFEELLKAAARLRQIRFDTARLPESTKEVSPAGDGEANGGDGSVFLVHGHAHDLRDTVNGFLTQLGVPVVVCQDTPAHGMTIIEKIEEAGGASFAVVILTPDDLGRAQKEQSGDEAARPRQNVIYELGYFTGKLGRHCVCVLQSGEMELPSDVGGQVFIRLNDPLWRLNLVREMRAAGLKVQLAPWL
jgi:predicted nucleotide-binding protein